jgi:hypothetical protein
VLALVPAVVVTGAAGAAFAAEPTTWTEDTTVSPWHAILVYVIIPVALFVGITLLVMLPSTRKAHDYHPGEAWRGEPEWFGGPRGGVETLDAGAPATAGSDRAGSDRGGASGSW